jgi:hypothetical protein
MQAASTAVRQLTLPKKALDGAVALWLVVAIIGQWAFFAYIAAFYGGSLIDGDFDVWNRLQALGRTPYIEGDGRGNWVFLTHALGAGLVALGGALQFIPAIRKHAPRFHRWNGRVFLITVVVLSLSGFYLEWIRDQPPTTLDGYATSVNGVLILGFAFLAYRAVRARRIAEHRQWAMRLFLVSNAQWFTRVGLFGYFVICKALGVGTDGAAVFFVFWKFGAFLVPLAVAELYLRSERRGASFRISVASLIFALTLLMMIGMVGYGFFTFRLATGAPLGI